MRQVLGPEDARVGFPVPAREEEDVGGGEGRAGDGGAGAPSVAVFTRDAAAGGEAEGEEVEQVREEEDGQGVVEVGGGLVGGAEGAVGQCVWAVGEIEASCVYGCDAGFEQLVVGREGAVGPKRGEAGEEHVVGGLEAGGCQGEDVFGGEDG